VDDLNTVVGNPEPAQLGFDARSITDQIQTIDVAVVVERLERPGNDVLGGEVPTHRIDGQFHGKN
jgi:hypothetical protein